MGIKSQTERQTDKERERREMYLLLILLLSPALGRPSSDVGAEINNQLDDLVNFSDKTGKLLNNPNLFRRVSESLKGADEKVLAMEAVLDDLRSKIPALDDADNYFPGYIKAKSFLRQTRQELRELAHRTVKEVGNMMSLLDDLDNSKISVVLEFAIDRMKLLMNETKKQLDKANKKYKEARLTFDNLKSSLALHHEILKSEIQDKENKQAQFEINEEYTNRWIYNCKWAALPTIGLCPLINHIVNVIPLENARVEIATLSLLTPRFVDAVSALTRDIDNVIGEVDKEIDLINRWAVSAEQVHKNIKDFPEEALREYAAVRSNFRRSLLDLKMNAQNFLNL